MEFWLTSLLFVCGKHSPLAGNCGRITASGWDTAHWRGIAGVLQPGDGTQPTGGELRAYYTQWMGHSPLAGNCVCITARGRDTAHGLDWQLKANAQQSLS